MLLAVCITWISEGCGVSAEPLNIGGIVATVVSLLLLGLAIITGLLLYYSPVFCWKGKSFPEW